MTGMHNHQIPSDWHTRTPEDITTALGSSLADGLSDQEARQHLDQYGPNSLTAGKKAPFWEEFFEELREPMVLMLLVTGVLYAIWGELADAITIFVIILTLNTVEVVNEQRSKRAIASLRKLAEPSTPVRRGGRYLEIPVEQVVPGDVIYLRDGHRLPADARLVEACGISVDESALTGESMPVDKSTAIILDPQTPLAERYNMAYSSTLVTRGKGTALVVATGMDTEIGHIAGMARQVKEPRTPLQKMMDELSKFLVWFALGFSVLVPLVGIFLAHLPVKQMLLTGLSLAFATIPEEMPIIITMVLALGAYRLSRKNAIVKRLNAVETLGSVTVIATDKTGTLTENRMEVRSVEPQPAREKLLEVGILCNDAQQNGDDYAGDPVDTALLRAARRQGLVIDQVQKRFPIINEFTFDNVRKRMSVVCQAEGSYWVGVKGAPESILPLCTQVADGNTTRELTVADRQVTLEQVAGMAAQGLRVIAMAERTLGVNLADRDAVEAQLTLLGMVGLQDPPRPEVAEAIATCKRAGVRTLMITGDHPRTAESIARQVGLDSHLAAVTGIELDKASDAELSDLVRQNSIFARTTPEHKLRIVQALQAMGERVAVTGDGVNDAPALSAADIGVAMGETGTDVAREAGAMLLLDDNFSTIVNAVREGRLIYENLKKGVRYYLTCKVALVLITLIPTLLLIPVPFAPVQIILMELFMDLMAAAAFVAEGAEADLLDQKPRDPRARFMDRPMIGSIFTSSLGLFAAVSALYLFTWYGTRDQTTSQTMAFFAWLVGHVLLAFNMRSERQPMLQLGIGSNRIMLIWGALVAVFLLVISLIPAARQLMRITSLTLSQWGLIIGATFMGTIWMEVKKMITYRSG